MVFRFNSCPKQNTRLQYDNTNRINVFSFGKGWQTGPRMKLLEGQRTEKRDWINRLALGVVSSKPLLESIIYVARRPRTVATACSTISHRVGLSVAQSCAARSPSILLLAAVWRSTTILSVWTNGLRNNPSCDSSKFFNVKRYEVLHTWPYVKIHIPLKVQITHWKE